MTSLYHKNIFITVLIYSILTLCLYIYIGDIFGYIVNIVTLFITSTLALYLGNKIGGTYRQHYRYAYLVYLIISTIGIVIVIDNINNFGHQFGPNYDDSYYFENALLASKNLSLFNLYEVGIFENTLSLVIIVLRVLTFGSVEIELIHLLPVNWMLSTFAVFFAGQIASNVINKPIPLWILIISLVFNFTFLDTSTRLYRDIYILFFVLLSIILFMQRKKFKSLFFMLISFLTRGANAMLAILYLIIYSKTRNKNKGFSKILFTMILLMSVSYLLAPYMIRFATDITRSDKGQRLFETAAQSSIEEVIENRMRHNFEVRQRGELVESAYVRGGVVGTFIRSSYTLFYPFSFIDFKKSISYSSVYKSGSVNDGIFVSHIITNLAVLMWYLVIPLWIFGILKMTRGDSLIKGTLLYYFILVLLLTLVSGQIRHNLTFIFLNPLIVTIGYQYLKENFNNFHSLLFLGFGCILTLFNLV